MTEQINSIESSRNDITRLYQPGVIGFYDYFEVTELIGYAPNNREPINLFSLIVAEEGPIPEKLKSISWLTPKARLKVQGLSRWRFALARYHVSNTHLDDTLTQFSQTKRWELSGSSIMVGPLYGRKACFAPPDSLHQLPLNRLLKNNFWNGSYLVELIDGEKNLFPNFWENPAALQALSEAISGYVPLGIASLPDRLGNIIIQLPVSLVQADFQMYPDGQMYIDVTWHPKATPRLLRASCQIINDDLILECGSTSVMGPPVPLTIGRNRYPHRCIIWDDQFSTIIAATSDRQLFYSASITCQSSGMNCDHLTRSFSYPEGNASIPNKIQILQHSEPHIVGKPVIDAIAPWAERRMYRDEARRLKEQRKFVVYGPHLGCKKAEQERALQDLRSLLHEHGEHGSWLWDPFLDAKDILKTLFHNPHPRADLRALSACQGKKSQGKTKEWVTDQAETLEKHKGNANLLTLEFRAKTDSHGWNFHDRFIIFPSKRGAPRAWSLGTSVNSLGYQHHILMAVPDAQLIADAFLELWDKLECSQHKVWKV